MERFENSGTISLQDNEVGDVFTLSNTVGGTDLTFVATGKSKLAVDAYLGGPGSTADNLIIQGDVKGKTELKVYNTNTGPGAYNPKGIPIAFVDGTVSSSALFLKKPIDTGFFDYDLFFVPTGSGILRVAQPSGRRLPCPAAPDHGDSGRVPLNSETWFDRTADLRVLLNGGRTPAGTPADCAVTRLRRAELHHSGRVGAEAPAPGSIRRQRDHETVLGRTYGTICSRDLNIEQFPDRHRFR